MDPRGHVPDGVRPPLPRRGARAPGARGRFLDRPHTGHQPRRGGVEYAWGDEFQLAADIIETSITTDWEAIARVGAIAVIRTFLNYFLERDLAEVRERQAEPKAERASTAG